MERKKRCPWFFANRPPETAGTLGTALMTLALLSLLNIFIGSSLIFSVCSCF
jgi:hypothetical protein